MTDNALPIGDNRPPVYYDKIDGKTVLVIRASAIGHPCLWELIAAGQGVEPQPTPRFLQRAFDEGNAAEEMILRRVATKLGITYESHQEEGHLWLGDDVVIRYHPDGLGYFDMDNVVHRPVIEAKYLSDALWTKFVNNGMESVMDEYAWQLSVMMHDTGREGLWCAVNKGGVWLEDYGHRAFTKAKGKLHTQLVYEPPISLTEIQLKASLIKQGVEDEDILTSDRTCDSPDQFPCRYYHVRLEDVPDESAVEVRKTLTLEKDSATDFDDTVRQYLYFKGQVDELSQKRDQAKRELLDKAGEDAVRVVGEKYNVPIVRGTYTSMDVGSMSEADRATWEALKEKYTVRKPKAAYPGKVKRLDL